jgi:hypothetical protein
MYGKSTNPDAVDLEKEKDFYPVKTLTVHTTKFVTNHGRWICGIELSFWDSNLRAFIIELKKIFKNTKWSLSVGSMI